MVLALLCLAATPRTGNGHAPPPALPNRWPANKDYRTLPLPLLQLGRFAYGDSLDDIINRTALPTSIMPSVRGQDVIHLVQSPGDNTAETIRDSELLTGDVYGVHRLIQLHPPQPDASPSPPRVAVDIGANIGYFTILITRALPDAVVIALEAAPTTFFYLCWNLHLNHVRYQVSQSDGSDAGTAEANNTSTLQFSRANGGVLAFNRVASDVERGFTFYSHPLESQLSFAIPDNANQTVRQALLKDAKRHIRQSSNHVPWRSQHVLSLDVLPYVIQVGAVSVAFLKIDCESCKPSRTTGTLEHTCAWRRAHRSTECLYLPMYAAPSEQLCWMRRGLLIDLRVRHAQPSTFHPILALSLSQQVLL